MFCGTPSLVGAPAGSREAPQPVSEELYAGLRLGMHAMAQPITLLLSHFYLAKMKSSAPPPLFNEAADALEELSTIFRLMQELLHVSSAGAHVKQIPLATVLNSLADDAEAVFAGTGLRFDLRLDPPPGLVCGSPAQEQPSQSTYAASTSVMVDMQRMRHATAGILHVARIAAEPGSTIICSLSVDSQHSLAVEFKPSSTRKDARARLNETALLKMRLAEASLVSQGAGLHFTEEPFALCFKLPLAG